MIAAAGRRGTAADAILGVRPECVVEPSTVEEARAALREAAASRSAVGFAGGETQLDLGAPPERLDVLVRTAGLVRIVDYSPADQVVVVEAGVPLADLQRELARHRQRLALDPPLPERATVGGIVAANAFGPRRARYGSVRDLLIGVSFVRADGVLARGGGKVVKNVAGFDLPRLMVGSLGTLGLIATATFRLHPEPEADSTVRLAGCSPGAVRALVRAIRDAQLEPAAVLAADWGRFDAVSFDVLVRFEGFGAGVAEQTGRLREVAGRLSLDVELLGGDAARGLWARHDAARTGPSLRLRIASPPSKFEWIARELAGVRAALRDAESHAYPTLGIAFVGGEADPAARAADAIAAARGRLAEVGGALVVDAAPAAVRARADVWGPPPASIDLMRRVKGRFDPDRRLAPGRFVGGI
jgi:glycolate oxidase FAD binding subunit